jgi:hypothetical protein
MQNKRLNVYRRFARYLDDMTPYDRKIDYICLLFELENWPRVWRDIRRVGCLAKAGYTNREIRKMWGHECWSPEPGYLGDESG